MAPLPVVLHVMERAWGVMQGHAILKPAYTTSWKFEQHMTGYTFGVIVLILDVHIFLLDILIAVFEPIICIHVNAQSRVCRKQ